MTLPTVSTPQDNWLDPTLSVLPPYIQGNLTSTTGLNLYNYVGNNPANLADPNEEGILANLWMGLNLILQLPGLYHDPTGDSLEGPELEFPEYKECPYHDEPPEGGE